MARLILATAEGQQVVELRPVNSLGRHPNNSIQLLDKIVSKDHCIVELRGDHFVLRDLGSLNGTYINGERVAGEQGLRHGDEISLGATKARFDETSGAVATPARPAPAPPGPPASVGFAPSVAAPSAGPPSPPSRPPGFPMPPASPLARSGATDAAALLGIPPNLLAHLTNNTQSPMGATRIELADQKHEIGAQIAAVQKGFQPYEQLVSNPAQLRDDVQLALYAVAATQAWSCLLYTSDAADE